MAVSPAELRRTLIDRARETRRADEARRARAVEAIRGACEELARTGALDAAWLIGSAAWGGFGERSDVDLVVRGLLPARLTETADRLSASAGVAVDLLRWEELDECFRTRIEREGVRLS